MVSLDLMRASNETIQTALPAGLVAVFAGATSGIGETSLKQFARHAARPRVYFLGRRTELGERIAAELRELNPDGEYYFIGADLSLLRTVDDVCRQIALKEQSINLLFLTVGTITLGKDTDEGLYYPAAVTYYGRVRLMVNLAPLMRRAAGLRRVVTVFTATKEGRVDAGDFPARRVSMLSMRGHHSSMTTLSLEAVARRAPEVSFVHDFPGMVQSDLGHDLDAAWARVARSVFNAVAPFMPTPEAGERQLFMATSARYPASKGGNANGVVLPAGVEVARGTDGEVGSGVYSVNFDGETVPAKVEKLLAGLRAEGVVDKLWEHTEEEFLRITGSAAAQL